MEALPEGRCGGVNEIKVVAHQRVSVNGYPTPGVRRGLDDKTLARDARNTNLAAAVGKPRGVGGVGGWGRWGADECQRKSCLQAIWSRYRDFVSRTCQGVKQGLTTSRRYRYQIPQRGAGINSGGQPPTKGSWLGTPRPRAVPRPSP